MPPIATRAALREAGDAAALRRAMGGIVKVRGRGGGAKGVGAVRGVRMDVEGVGRRGRMDMVM
jgi:hypothetical protein